MKNVVVLRLSALGDVIHTIPAVVSLRDHARVTWVVEAPYRELVELVAGVATIPVRLKKWPRAPFAHRAEIGAAYRALRGGFDEAIDFQGLIKSAVLMRLSGAPVRYGFDREAIREKQATWFANRHVHVDTAKHVVDQNLELAGSSVRAGSPRSGRLEAGAPSGGPVAPSGGPVVPSGGLVAPSGGPGAPSGGRVAPSGGLVAPRFAGQWDAFPLDSGLDAFRESVVLLPGAGKPNKLWPIERFRELARRIGPSALAVWGPGERELAEAIGARVAPPTNLRELAWLLRSARVVIGADTGPLHLADALGTKVIGLYGPTDPRRNGPHGQLQRCIDHFASAKSMESISVEEVMKALERVSAE